MTFLIGMLCAGRRPRRVRAAFLGPCGEPATVHLFTTARVDFDSSTRGFVVGLNSDGVPRQRSSVGSVLRGRGAISGRRFPRAIASRDPLSCSRVRMAISNQPPCPIADGTPIIVTGGRHGSVSTSPWRDGALSGRWFDAQLDHPFSGAALRHVQGVRAGSVSDTAGRWPIEGLAPGRYPRATRTAGDRAHQLHQSVVPEVCVGCAGTGAGRGRQRPDDGRIDSP